MLVDRRGFLAGLAAGAALRSVPARARSGSVFDRTVSVFTPAGEAGSLAERLNAVLARVSAEGGGTVRLSAGTFWTEQQVIILDNTRLVGVGQDKTEIKLLPGVPSFTSRAGIVRAKRDSVPIPQRFVHNILIEDLTIDGNRTGQRQDVYDEEKKYGFYSETRDAVLRRVTIRNCMGYGFDPHGAIDDTPSERTVIEDCHAYGNLKDGFTLDRQVDMVFRRNLAENNDRAGVNAVTTTLRTVVEDNIIRNNLGTGITIQNGSAEMVIRNNTIEGNDLEGVYLRSARDLRVSSNVVRQNGRAGIRVRGGHDIEVMENRVERNLRDLSSGHSEIHLDSYKGDHAQRVLVSANTVTADRNGAIKEDNGASGNRIVGNTFRTRADGIETQPNLSHASDNREAIY